MSLPSSGRFIEHVGLVLEEQRAGFSRCSLHIAPHHFNSSGVVHGAVAFTLADTGMGAALMPGLQEGEKCATVEVNINYLKPVFAGVLTCTTEVVNRGKRVAHLESSIHAQDTLVAKASGVYAIFRPSTPNAA